MELVINLYLCFTFHKMSSAVFSVCVQF